MILTIAYDVKNYVEVMESWPISDGGMTFFVETDDNVLKRVCVSFRDVGIEHAPNFTPSLSADDTALLKVTGGIYATKARKSIMSWQTVICGVQVVDLDFDHYEIRFRAQNFEEDSNISITKFKVNSDHSLNNRCDFEQIGRAFCAGDVEDSRIELTSHFREGRLAYVAGRYVDSYNQMFLFLESRYCKGKTDAKQQARFLSSNSTLCEIIEKREKEFKSGSNMESEFKLFDGCKNITDKITNLIKLRGKLRHHNINSPNRWDPNKQLEHKLAALFLGAVVGDIVISETMDSLYSETCLKRFSEISIASGNSIDLNVFTKRLEQKEFLSLNLNYPTTVVSTQLCLTALRTTIKKCHECGQLSDTVNLDATQNKTGLELFTVQFGMWAYTRSRSFEAKAPIDIIRCSFEHLNSGIVVKDEFSIPINERILTIPKVWEMLSSSFNHIERRDPSVRILSLKLMTNFSSNPIVTYRVGVSVRH